LVATRLEPGFVEPRKSFMKVFVPDAILAARRPLAFASPVKYIADARESG
jgi:hypothetical protein